MRKLSRIEALVDAFAKLNAMLDPFSDAYKLRNPLLLKAFSPKHEKDEQGRRIFSSFTSGYDNGIIDVKIKCAGKSHSKIGPESTLRDLTCLYGNSAAATRKVKNHLRHALETDMIFESTKLEWFLEDDPTSAAIANAVKEQ